MVDKKSVSTVISEIKSLLEGEFRQVSLIGEITNLSKASSGHWYFNLSDNKSSISAALFQGDALRNSIIKKIQDGDKVHCIGSIGLFAKRGTFQVIVKHLEVFGKGDLKADFEKLKLKLQKEGLFDSSVKKRIPCYPKRVGVITARNGAALQDFLNVFSRRSPHSDILIIPSLVQGENAPASLRKALFNTIKYSMEANEDKKLDTIVLTRGGGSLEDLWAFNDEALAWDIYNCPIPIISAIGHQVDFSISDYVADLRLETPTAAAEILTQGYMEISLRMGKSLSSLKNILFSRVQKSFSDIEELHPEKVLGRLKSRLHLFEKRLLNCSLDERGGQLTGLNEKLMIVDDLSKSLELAVNEKTKNIVRKIDLLENSLQALSPRQVLKRGYTYIKGRDKVIMTVKDYKKMTKNDPFEIVFSDGVGEAYVREK